MTIYQLTRNARRAALGKPKYVRQFMPLARTLSELKRPTAKNSMPKKWQRKHGLLPEL